MGKRIVNFPTEKFEALLSKGGQFVPLEKQLPADAKLVAAQVSPITPDVLELTFESKEYSEVQPIPVIEPKFIERELPK